MNLTQRQSIILIFVVILVAALAACLLLALQQQWSIMFISLGTAVAIGGLLATYLAGWQYASYVLVIVTTLIATIGTPDVEAAYTPLVFIGPALALVVAEPRWVLSIAAISAIILAARTGWQGPNADGINLVVYATVIGAMILARAVLGNMMRLAEAARQRAEAAQAQAEQQSAALNQANVAQQAQLDEQQRLLDLVATLETPAVALAEGVLLAPIMGHLDSRRSAALTARLLEAAYAGRARHVILDISGVATVDTAVAKTLLGTAHSLRLLGSNVILSGLSSQVALTLTQQGVSLNELTTVRSPQEALARI